MGTLVNITLFNFDEQGCFNLKSLLLYYFVENFNF